MNKTKKAWRTRKLKSFDQAAVAWAWKGSQPPEEQDEIEQAYVEAKARLLEALHEGLPEETQHSRAGRRPENVKSVRTGRLSRYEQALVAQSFKGAQPPEEHAEILQDYEEARSRLLEVLHTELPGVKEHG